MAEMQDQPYAAPPADFPQQPSLRPPSHNNGCMWLAVGCGAAALLSVILLFVIGFYAYRKMRVAVADLVVEIAEEAFAEIDLPEEQQQRLMARLEGLAEEFKKGELTLEEMRDIGERMAENKPLIAAGIIYAVEEHLLETVDLDSDERQRATRAVQRLARGVCEGKIELETLEEVIEPYYEVNTDREKVLKEDLTKEDILEMVESATAMADEAEIPDEPFEIDVAEEFDAIVDEVMHADR